MKLLYFLFFLSTPCVVLSQVLHVSTTSGKEQLISPTKASVLGKEWFRDGENAIVIDNAGGQLDRAHAITVRKIDANGKEVLVNNLEGGEKVFGSTPTEAFEFDNRIFLVYFTFKDRPLVKVQISELDKKSLSFINTKTLHQFEARNNGVISLSGVASQGINYILSPDTSNIFIYTPVSGDQIFSFVLEKGFTVTRERLWGMAKINKFSSSRAIFDKEGNVAIVFSENVNMRDDTRYVYMQNKSNKDRFIGDVDIEGGLELTEFNFGINPVNNKMLGFCSYKGSIETDGVLLYDMDFSTFKLNRIQKVVFSESFKKDVTKCGFGEKKRGNYGVRPASLWLRTFDNGDLVLTGVPDAIFDRYKAAGGLPQQYIFAGPIMMIFFKGQNYEPVVSMIPRAQLRVTGSQPLAIPYKDKLIVLYNDFEGALKHEIKIGISLSATYYESELSLAYAVVDKNGNIESRTVVAEPISRKNRFVPGLARFVNKNELLIPSLAEVDKETGVRVLRVKIE